MTAPDQPANSAWLSLPPVVPGSTIDVVGAPFAAHITQEIGRHSPPGMIAGLFGAGEAPFTHPDRFSLALDPNPLPLLAHTVQLSGPDPDDIASAFTRLLDQPYRGRPWGQYLQSLYVTSCPACGRPTMARSYRWQGSPPALMTKHVRCEHCQFDGETLAAAEDHARAAEAEPGPALRWEMMARVVHDSDPLRQRAEQALNFYTPRNLWILWQTLRILKEVQLTQDQRRAVQYMLSLALWHGSSLEAQPDLWWQPTLRRPRQFRERNLWYVFHEALAQVQQDSARLGRVQDEGGEPAHPPERPPYHLTQRWPGDFSERVPPQSVSLALLAVPPAQPLFWLMQYVWSGWLFGAEACTPLQNLLSLRPGGGDLLAQMLSASNDAISTWLSDQGRSLAQWRWRGEDDPSAAVLAALPACDGEIGIAALAENEWIALAALPKSPSRSRPRPALAAAEAIQDFLLKRGEPLSGARLRPALLAAWARAGLSGSTDELATRLHDSLNPLAPPPGIDLLGEHGEAWEPGDQPWWWLLDPPPAWQPASDEAERHLLALLHEQPFTDASAFTWALTLRLPLARTPDRPWIDALLASYCADSADGILRLRPEDDPARRQAELAELAGQLVQVGQQMGFETAGWPQEDCWTVEWQRRGRRWASFLLSATTALTPRVWNSRAHIPGLFRYLVLPGGRAGLVQWRFDHQPLWAAAASAGGWTFVKFRHLRQMLADADESPDIWLTHLGLDSITAAQSEQMRLF